MRKRKIMIWVIGVVGIAVIAFFAIGPAALWRAVAGDPDLGAQNFEAIVRTGKPNDALMAPAFIDQYPGAAQTPVFAVDADTLFTTLLDRIDQSGDVRWAERNQSARYARGITFSPLLKFPDTNHIWAVENSAGEASLVLYAAAQLGQSDLGKNQARLEAWLALIDDLPRVP